MKRSKAFPAILAIAVALVGVSIFRKGGVAPKPEVFAHGTTLATALAASQTSGKPVLAFVTADWCGPCQSLKRGALVNPKVAALIIANTEPVYVDGTNPSADVARLNVEGFPTLILLRPGIDGEKEISRLVGNADTARVLDWLTSVK